MSRDPAPETSTTPLKRRLEQRVAVLVSRLISKLPPELRRHAEALPVFCEWQIPAHWLEDGVAPDSLGLFSGPSLLEGNDPDDFESPRITLFLEQLWDYCKGDHAAFDDEVRLTYIHEFGHYLGLEEADLAARHLL